MPEQRPESAVSRADQSGPHSSKGEPDPLIGRLVNGRFKILSVIARGGMGKVYKAEQAPLGRICALKVLSPKYEGDRDPEFHKRFFLEASTAAKLTHPNTVTIFDYGQEGDELYFIAMEFIEGRTLHRVLRDEGALTEARVAHVASQICRSLREAHGLGVVHRDLKPGNVLLSDRGDERDNVKVLDFGLVKDVSGEAEDLTQAGLFMGSPKYMAPEQILGGEISARTDIYSLGVMMYEMLSGKVPFDRGASVGTLMAHVNDVPPPMRDVNPKLVLSSAMEGIVKRCLEKDAAKRFASMKDLLNSLKRVGLDEGARLTDTHESLMMVLSPDSVSASAPPPSISGPLLRSDAPGAPSITDSQTGPGPAPPLDTDAMAKMGPKGRSYVWILAAAVAAGIVSAVLFSSRRPTTDPAPNGVAPAGTNAATDSTAGPTAALSAATAPSTASGPQIRTVRIETDPPGASVSDGTVELCSNTPCEMVLKGDAAKVEHKLTLMKKGYKNGKATVAVTDDKVSTKLDVFVGTSGPRPTAAPTGTVKHTHSAYD